MTALNQAEFAALKEFEAELREMGESSAKDELDDALRKIEREEPWAEALTAYLKAGCTIPEAPTAKEPSTFEGVGTTFGIGDLPEDTFATDEEAQAFLEKNAKHIRDAMARAGFDAISTCLSFEGIQEGRLAETVEP